MRATCLVLALMSTTAAAWTPPEKPVPGAILKEARDDRVARRYEEALQKHVWFHTEALKHDSGQGGVRLSFALGDWGTLAARYPPALDALRKARDEAAANVKADFNVLHNFTDLAALDRELDETAATLDAFRWIESRRPEWARLAYGRASDALIEAGDFATAAKYIDPDEDLRFAARLYTDIGGRGPGALPGTMTAEQRERARAAMAETGERMFAITIGKAVAVLVLAGKPQEAARLAAEARKVSDSPVVAEILAKASAGQLPPPFFSKEAKAELRRHMP